MKKHDDRREQTRLTGRHLLAKNRRGCDLGVLQGVELVRSQGATGGGHGPSWSPEHLRFARFLVLSPRSLPFSLLFFLSPCRRPRPCLRALDSCCQGRAVSSTSPLFSPFQKATELVDKKSKLVVSTSTTADPAQKRRKRVQLCFVPSVVQLSASIPQPC